MSPWPFCRSVGTADASSRRTTIACPPAAASISGVSPLVVRAARLAPERASRSTTSAWPRALQRRRVATRPRDRQPRLRRLPSAARRRPPRRRCKRPARARIDPRRRRWTVSLRRRSADRRSTPGGARRCHQRSDVLRYPGHQRRLRPPATAARRGHCHSRPRRAAPATPACEQAFGSTPFASSAPSAASRPSRTATINGDAPPGLAREAVRAGLQQQRGQLRRIRGDCDQQCRFAARCRPVRIGAGAPDCAASSSPCDSPQPRCPAIPGTHRSLRAAGIGGHRTRRCDLDLHRCGAGREQGLRLADFASAEAHSPSAVLPAR